MVPEKEITIKELLQSGEATPADLKLALELEIKKAQKEIDEEIEAKRKAEAEAAALKAKEEAKKAAENASKNIKEPAPEEVKMKTYEEIVADARSAMIDSIVDCLLLEGYLEHGLTPKEKDIIMREVSRILDPSSNPIARKTSSLYTLWENVWEKFPLALIVKFLDK